MPKAKAVEVVSSAEEKTPPVEDKLIKKPVKGRSRGSRGSYIKYRLNPHNPTSRVSRLLIQTECQGQGYRVDVQN